MDAQQIRRLEPELLRVPRPIRRLLRSQGHSCPPGHVRPGATLRPAREERRADRPGGGRRATHPAGVPQPAQVGRGLDARPAPADSSPPSTPGPHTIGIIDETSDPKKGDKTPGVQKQWCGRLGKTENCIVTVHLASPAATSTACSTASCILPESWDADRDRCREAGIPDDMVYRPKWKIALELYDRAVANGIRFDWLTFDEGYGSKPEFLRALSGRGQRYVGEVPRSFTGWLDPPRVVTRPYRRNGRGRGRKVPRLASGSPPARRVDEMLGDPRLRDQTWQRFRVKDGQKGPMVWECKHVMITVKDADGLPGETLHLVVARDVLEPDEMKFFVSNAPPGTTASGPCCWSPSRAGAWNDASRTRRARSAWTNTRVAAIWG